MQRSWTKSIVTLFAVAIVTLVALLFAVFLPADSTPAYAAEPVEGTTTTEQVSDASGVMDADALKAAVEKGGEVVLGSDITADVVVPATVTVTIDLNGYTLTNDGDHTIVNNGTLTVEDSSTGETGKVDNVTHGKGALVNYGVATLSGGTFTRSKEASISSSDGNGNSWYTLKNYGEMTIDEGVTVTTGSPETSTGEYSSLISNGFQSKSDYNSQKDKVTTTNVAKLTINGGKFSGGLNTVKNDEVYSDDDQVLSSTLVITGGEFTNTAQHVILNYGDAKISGGTFDAPSASAAIWNVASAGDASYSKTLGKADITGGTFNGGTFLGGLNSIKNDDYGVLTIKDATVKNVAQAALLNWNVATIEGGSFSTDGGSAVILNGYINDTMDKGELTITGGEFTTNGGDFPLIARMDGSKPTGGVITVTVTSTNADLVAAAINVPGVTTYVKEGDAVTEMSVSDLAGLKEALNTETVKKITLACDITSDESLFFERDVTLDMNGYELTVAKTTTYEQNGKTYTYHPVVIDKANVTIVNGNIMVGKGVYANLNAILVTNGATLTLGTKSDETVVEDDRVFVTTNSGYGIVVSGGAALNMYGGSVTAKWSALGTNNTTGTAAFNVYGATLESTDDSAIFMSCYTDVYLKDTAVIGKTAIDIRIGNLTVDGGSITSTYDGYHEMTYDEVTASGTLTGGDGSAILVKANYYYDNANKSNEVSISISSETTITGAVTIYDLDGVGNMLDGKENVTDQTVNLQTFVDELKTSHASVETHLYDVAPADGSGDGTIVDVDKVHADAGEQVTAIVSSLDELRAAFAEKKIGKIVIGADFEISGNRIEIGDINDPNAATRSITLDLNGHTLKIGTIRVSDTDSSANTAALYLGYNVSLTLTDTVDTGIIDASGANDLTVPIGAMRSSSTLTVKSGTIIVDTDRESCVFARGGGKIVIIGGTFINNCTSEYAYGEGKPLTVNIENNSTSTIDITGGTFKGRNPMSGDDNTDVAFVSKDSKVVEYKSGNMEVVAQNSEVTGDDVVAVYTYADNETGDTVATVYTEDALRAALADKNYDTVVLGADIGNASETFVIDRPVTLDLNGYTLENKNTTSGNYLLIEGGNSEAENIKVTIRNGNISSGDAAVFVMGYADVVMENVSVKTDGRYGLELYGECDQSVTAEGCTFEGDTSGVAVFGAEKTGMTAAFSATDCTIKGGDYGVSGNGTYHLTTIDIVDSKVSSDRGTAIYHPQVGTLTISGGSEISGISGIEMRAGTLKISGNVSVVATAEEFSVSDLGDGPRFDGVALGVSRYFEGSDRGVTLDISGGTFVAQDKGYAFYEKDIAVAGAEDNTSLSFAGATFNGDLYSENETGFIKSGTFSEVFDSKYLSDSTALYIPTGDGASGYVVAPTSGAPEGASVVAAVMDGKGYASISDAIAAINDTEQHTITLVDLDGDNDNIVTGEGVFLGAGNKNIVIDFNGLTYNVNTLVGSAGTESQLFHLEKGNTVTLKNGTIGVDTAASGVLMFIQNYSFLTLDNMTVDSSAYNDVSYTVSNNNGSLTVTGDTTIKAADGKVAFDVWYGMYESYYDGVTVTFDEGFTGTVIGKVEYGAATATSEWMEKTKIEFNSPDGVFDIDIDMSKNVPDATDANINVESGTFSEGVDLAYVADGQKVGVKPGGGMEVGSEISGEGFDAIYTVSGDVNASMSAIVYTADMFKKALDNDSVTEITLGKDFGGSYTIDRDVTIKAAEGVTFSGNIVIESSSVTRTTGPNVKLEGVAFKGNGSGTAISVKNGSLTITGGSIKDYDNGIVAGTRGGAAVDISVDNVEFTELDEKGIYGEAFGDLTVKNSTFNGAGNDASGAGNPYTGRSAAAIDINQTVAGGSVSITGNTFVDCGDNGSTSGAIKIKVRDISVEQSYGQAGDFAAEHNELVGSFEAVSVTNNTFTNCSRDIVVGTGYVAKTYVDMTHSGNESYESDGTTTRDLIFVDNAHVDDAESLMNAFADEDLVLIEVFANITTTDIIVVDKPGKSVVLDLNGYTITANDTTTSTENGVSIGAGFLYLADGTLTVKDGTVNAIEDSFRVQTEATDDYAKLILADDLTVTSQNANAVYIRALNQQESTTPNAVLETAADLKVSGKYAAIQGNGTSTDGPVSVTVTGGDIVADPADETIDGTGLYLPGRGEYLITGGTITAPTGVEFRAGTLTITGGTITATGEFAADPNGNGATTSGVAVAMMQHTTERDLTLNITGGEFNGAYAVYQQNIQNNDSGMLTMSLTGGTFNGNVDSENCTEYISGGLYSVKPAAEAFDPGFDGVEYDGYYVVIKTTTDDIAALLAARIDAQADVRTYAAVLGIDWKAMEALADTDDVAAAALDAYNAIGNATSEGYVAIARSAAMDALDAYAAAMAESELEAAKLKAQTTVKMYIASADIGGWTNLLLINENGERVEKDAVAPIFAMYDMIEESTTVADIDAYMWKAISQVDTYVNALENWRKAAADEVTAAAQETAENANDAVVVPTSVYAAINGAVNYTEVNAYKTNALAEIADIRAYRADIAEQGSELDLIYGTLTEFKNAFDALDTSLTGENNAFDTLLKDVQDAITTAQNAITGGTDESSESLASIKSYLENTIYKAMTDFKADVDKAFGDLGSDLAAYGDVLIALRDALVGDGTDGSVGKIDEILADIADAQSDITNIKTTVGSLATTEDLTTAVTDIKGALTVSEGKITSAITAAQNAITSAIASVRTDIDALETALAGYESDFEGLSGTLAQINSSLGGKIDAAQADIDAIKTAIDALGTPASAAAVTELATAIDELKAAVNEISVSVSAPSAVETVKTEATADIAEWLNAYVDEIVNSVTASNGKAYAAAVTFAPALETTDGDLYAKLLKAFDKDNADLVLKYYNDALTAIDAATTADEVNTAVATFKAQVASVEAASGNTSDLTVVYVLLIVVLVVLVVAVVVAAVLSRKRRVPVGYAPAPTPAPAPATSETTEQTEKAALAEKPEVTDDTAATAVEPDEAPDEDAGERVVINASVKTFDEAYDEMSDTLKDMFEKVREYALSKNGATGVRIGNGVRVKRGSKQIVKLTVRRGYPVAMFVLENEMLKDYRRTAGSSAKLKVPATELVLREPSDLDAAYMMVDLAVRQLDADVEAAKERRRELLRERRRQRREAMEAAKAAQAAQAEATTEQAEPAATEQNEAATPEQAVDEDKTE